MRSFCTILFLLCVRIAAAQNDSLIHYETHTIELKATSAKTAKGSYYDCISKTLQTGDQLFIEDHSDSYSTSVEIIFPDKKSKIFYDSLSNGKNITACNFSIPIREPGVYELRFGAVKPGAKGISQVTIAHCNRREMMIDPLWTTCQKLQFILDLSHTNFDLLPTTPVRNAPDAGFTPCCNFLNESPGMLYGLKDPNGPKTYKVLYLEHLGLNSAKTILKQVDQQLRKCMGTDWQTDNAPANTGTEVITYTQSGNAKYEFNPVHLQGHFQNRIRLELLKMGNGEEYDITIVID